jgi:transcriptional regulator NrdR family protein
MIVCADCGGESSVKDSRPVQNTIRRRRRCDSCGASWTTFEVDRESILKLREASQLFSELENHRKRMSDLANLASSFDEMEMLASKGRGRTKHKRQLKPRQPIAEVVTEIVEQ